MNAPIHMRYDERAEYGDGAKVKIAIKEIR